MLPFEHDSSCDLGDQHPVELVERFHRALDLAEGLVSKSSLCQNHFGLISLLKELYSL